ncbi:MAG: hypothetical protein JXL80_10280 [Planctomycetes bacterium]|nr:hypothetical protein [Planctomycetota bacterium]
MNSSGHSLHVGIGRESLWGAWQTDLRLADETDVRALVVRGGDVTAALLVGDVSCFTPATCLRLRGLAARAIGVDPSHVGIFATQNHSTPLDDDAFDASRLDAAFVAAARDATARLQPAEVARVAVRPEPPLCYCRRVPIEGLGKFTFWNGFRFDDAGRLDCSHLVKRALARLAQGRPYQYRAPGGPGSRPGEEDAMPESPMPVPEPLPLPDADDELLQGLFFRRTDGTPIGSLVRLAAHPDIGNVAKADALTGDYPAYVRRHCEEAFGGTGVFMTGPCGDQTSRREGKGLDLARRLGRQVAEAAMAALPEATWQSDARVAVTSPTVALRVREDYPASKAAAEKAMADLEAAMLAAAVSPQADLAEIKRLSDAWERQMYVGWDTHRRWTGIDLAGRAGQTVEHPLFVLRIGESVIAGLPGEPFGRYSRRMRDESIGDALIVSEQGNGYLGYVCLAADYDTGGYGANSMIFTRDAEDVLVDTIRRAVASL